MADYRQPYTAVDGIVVLGTAKFLIKDGVVQASGTTAERGNTLGMFRYNNELDQFEGRTSSGWGSWLTTLQFEAAKDQLKEDIKNELSGELDDNALVMSIILGE